MNDFLLESGWLILKCFIVLSIFWVAISFVIKGRNDFTGTPTRWHHSFNDQQFSSAEIYSAVSEKIKAKKMPSIIIGKVKRFQGGAFEGRRQYLRVYSNDQVFLICAAPYGTGYFISWWSGLQQDLVMDILMRIPFISRLLERLQTKSYYEIDTETMFTEAIKHCVHEVVAELGSNAGVRGIAELDQHTARMQEQ